MTAIYEPWNGQIMKSACIGPCDFTMATTGSPLNQRYFAGELAALNELPVRTAGTPFQREVWRALREIPHGTTVSYGKLAEQIGRPKAVRAVGLANGSNPIGVVVPCHRVIGSNGSLTGYGGGIERKRWLLEHENKNQPANLPLKLP
jgi:methylated-DNA-[protein]-cysteine S-methyltransferase